MIGRGVCARAWCAAVLALGLCGAAAAQPAPSPTGEAPGVSVSADGTRVSYGPAFFEPYNPVTAIDILRRIPGLQDVVKLDDTLVPGAPFAEVERRGFGSTGEQILINGQRAAGKANDTATALQRIQARQVERVEVIRGAVAGLDVRSEGVVVNVVLREVGGLGAWQGTASLFTGGRVQHGGRVSYAGIAGALNYTLSVERDPQYQQRDRVETRVDPAGTPFLRFFEVSEIIEDEYTLAANLDYAFAGGDRLALNGSYTVEDTLEEFPAYQFALAGPAATFALFDNRARDSDETEWEIGGDYQRTLAGGAQLKGLFVYTDTAFSRLSPFRRAAPGAPETLVRLQRERQDETEQIVRGSVSWAVSPRLTAEAGGETAINTLEKTVDLQVAQGGALRPVPLFNGQSRIRETRFEPFATLAWQASSRLFVDASLEAEYSRLTQTGRDVNNARSLFYLRPGVDLRYAVDALTQVRAGLRRTVSQLDFATFVATFENDDNRADVVNAGNPDLVPEKAWEAQVTIERRLAGDAGVASLKAFFNDISDKIDNIPVGPDLAVSAVGNVGAARAYGLEAKASLRLTALGLRGVVVNASGLARRSRMTDAFTGRRSDFPDYPDYAYALGFRHDTAWRDVSYGATVDGESLRYASDIDFYHVLKRKFDGQAFVEAPLVGGVKGKLEVRHALRSGATRERFTFTGNRGFSPLLRRELRRAKFERVVAFTLSGTF